MATPLGLARCPSSPYAEATAQNQFVPSARISTAVTSRFPKAFGLLDAKYSATFDGAITDYAVPLGVSKYLANKFGYNIGAKSPDMLPSMFPSPLYAPDAVMKFVAVLGTRGESTFIAQETAAQVTDGLSHTMMMTEIAGRPDHWVRGASDAPVPLLSAWADYDASGFYVQGSRTNASADICLIQCDNRDEMYSFHPAGVNCLYADGHVAKLRVDTDPRVVLAAVTPDQGDAAPE